MSSLLCSSDFFFIITFGMLSWFEVRWNIHTHTLTHSHTQKFHRRLESSPKSRVGTPNPNVKHKAVTWHRVGGGVEYL